MTKTLHFSAKNENVEKQFSRQQNKAQKLTEIFYIKNLELAAEVPEENDAGGVANNIDDLSEGNEFRRMCLDDSVKSFDKSEAMEKL